MCNLDELQALMRDCGASFVITDVGHVDRVQLAASSITDNESTDEHELRQVDQVFEHILLNWLQ